MTGRSPYRIGRRRSMLQIRGTPVLSVMLASLLIPMLPIIAQSPILPPLGFMVLVAWRVLRPEIWPLWIGLPLGLFDDVTSGQPVGSAMVSWTLMLLLLDLEGRRNFWRDYWHSWFIAALALTFTILFQWAVVHLSGHGGPVLLVMPQLACTIGLFPFVVRLCAALDRWRLP